MIRAACIMLVAAAVACACMAPVYGPRWYRTGLASGYRPFGTGGAR